MRNKVAVDWTDLSGHDSAPGVARLPALTRAAGLPVGEVARLIDPGGVALASRTEAVR